MGNVEFAEGDDVDSSKPKDEKSLFHLRTAAEIFMYVSFFFLVLQTLKCAALYDMNSNCGILGVMRKPWKIHYVNALS